MILQALKEYYDRMAADPESGIAPEGWEWRRFLYSAEIDENGKFVQFHELKEERENRQIGKLFLAPALGEKKGNGIKANFTWENIEYLFEIPIPSKAKPEPDLGRVKDQHMAFCEKLRTLQGNSIKIVALRHYNVDDLDRIQIMRDPLWEDIRRSNQFIALSMKDNVNTGWLPIFTDKEVKKAINDARPSKGANGYCLITGEKSEIVRLEPAGIKGVKGFDGKAERTFVSFNQDPFCSFRKEKNLNSPIGKQAAFAYTTALNTLLNEGTNQNMLIGDASVVFWSAKKTQFESDFSFFFKEPYKDNPEEGTAKIRNLFEAPITGGYLDDDSDTKFYVLGLAPNAARIAVRFWEVGTVSDFAGKIRQHFEDLEILKPTSEPRYYSISKILKYIAVQDKSENIPPNVAGDFMRSILDGTPYPQTLLQAALRRIHSDAKNRVKPVRASLIKGYLNRYLRAHPNQREKEVEMGLDTEQPSVGYQLGRLFAVLEKVQEEASPGLNATIRERYYAAACSSPVTVFGTLMRLKNHHLAKLDNKGRTVNFERLIGSIMNHITDFPSHLDLHEQGRFAIGYYHQRQDFFTKKENDNQ